MGHIASLPSVINQWHLIFLFSEEIGEVNSGFFVLPLLLTSRVTSGTSQLLKLLSYKGLD